MTDRTDKPIDPVDPDRSSDQPEDEQIEHAGRVGGSRRGLRRLFGRQGLSDRRLKSGDGALGA